MSEPNTSTDEQKGGAELTYGQKVVGLSFNPSGDEKVVRAKQLSADLIDLAHDTATPEDSRFVNGLRTAAINAVLSAQMLVVKLITWRE